MNSFIASYNRAPAQTVSDVYKNPSEEKENHRTHDSSWNV